MLICPGCLVVVIFSMASVLRAENIQKCSGIENVTCGFVEVDCGVELESSDAAPGSPVDLRLSQIIKAVPSGDPSPYLLQVNMSWVAPREAPLTRLKGFYLSVLDRRLRKKVCFRYFFSSNVTDNGKNRHDAWFDFSVEGVFKFATPYTFTVQSLPKKSHNASSNARSNSKNLLFTTPEHPAFNSGPIANVAKIAGWSVDDFPDQDLGTNCSQSSHPDAGGWVGAFYKVVQMPWAGKLVVTFVAAPAKYCFESYELRLYTEHNNIVDRVRVPGEALYLQREGNASFLLGNHTFEDVYPGIYGLSISPVDKSEKYGGRCLCLLQNKMCTCSEAMWKGIQYKSRPTALSKNCEKNSLLKNSLLCYNVTAQHLARKTFSGTSWFVFCLLALAALALGASAIFLRASYKKYANLGIAYTIPAYGQYMKKNGPGSGNAKSYENLLENDRPVNILLVYSKDSPDHQKTVENFVNLLQNEVKNAKILADFACQSEIAENKVDWVSNSLKKADKILLINSRGAFLRYESKLLDWSSSSSQNFDQSPNDLFLLQLDLLAEARFSTKHEISKKLATVRFAYTPLQYDLQHVGPSAGLRFQMPDHAGPLLNWLEVGSAAKSRGFDSGELSSDFRSSPQWYDLNCSIQKCGQIVANGPYEIAVEALDCGDGDKRPGRSWEGSRLLPEELAATRGGSSEDSSQRAWPSSDFVGPKNGASLEPHVLSEKVRDEKSGEDDEIELTSLKVEARQTDPLSLHHLTKGADSGSADSGICSDSGFLPECKAGLYTELKNKPRAGIIV